MTVSFSFCLILVKRGFPKGGRRRNAQLPGFGAQLLDSASIFTCVFQINQNISVGQVWSVLPPRVLSLGFFSSFFELKNVLTF